MTNNDILLIALHLWGCLVGGLAVWIYMSRKIRQNYVPLELYRVVVSDAEAMVKKVKDLAQLVVNSSNQDKSPPPSDYRN